MAYSTLQDLSDVGIKQILNFPNLDTPTFYPIFLGVIFMVFTALTFFREVNRTGKGNIMSSLAVGSFVMQAVAAILSLLELIQTEILVTAIVAGVVFEALFLLTNRQ